MMKLKTFLFCTALSAFGLNALAAEAAAQSKDSYQHIRNATGRIHYAGKTFLIDPMLAEKGRYAGFEGTLNSHLRNPLVDLPMSAEDTFKGVDAVIVTHTHLDHWDEIAQQILPKNMTIFVQHERDGALLRSQGFTHVQSLSLEQPVEFAGISLSKTGGDHGTAEMYADPQLAALLDEAMGVVLQAKGHKTLYLMGDTVWNAAVNKAINRYKPDVVIMNTGSARTLAFPNDGIIMGKEDVARARHMLPNAKLIAVHMNAVNHAAVSREDLADFVQTKGISNVAIPQDGETVAF